MVRLRRMDEREHAAWVERSRDGYAEQMAGMGGFTYEAAREKAARDLERLLPQGHATPGQHVFYAEAGGEDVGLLWLGEQPDALWVYEVETFEPHRGRGHGRAIMLLAEEQARALGFDAVALNVFTGNPAAIALYESLGYEVTQTRPGAQNMLKRLPPPAASPPR